MQAMPCFMVRASVSQMRCRSAFPVGYFTIPSVPHSKVLPGGGYMDAVMSGEVVCI